MPKIGSIGTQPGGGRKYPPPEPGTNGHGSNGRLAERLRKRDEVAIGSPNYEPGEEDATSSWEDVATLVGGVSWLLRRWVPYGMLTGLVAEPKVGKSAFALWALARPVLIGCPWFDGTPGPEPGHVVFCDTERSAAVNLERARRWGLPLGRLLPPFKEDPLRPINLDDPRDLDRLLSVVCYYKARLVVVDSFRGAHDGDENNSRIVKPLRQLASVAEESKAAVVLIHHAKKLTVGEDMTINAGRGSNAFLAQIRCQIAIDVPDPRPNLRDAWRRLQVLGENLGTAPRPVGFRHTGEGLVFGEAPTRPRKEAGEAERAAAWLAERLRRDGAAQVTDLLAAAQEQGLARRTLYRAADQLGVVRREQRGDDGRVCGSEWSLPPAPPPPGEKRPAVCQAGAAAGGTRADGQTADTACQPAVAAAGTLARGHTVGASFSPGGRGEGREEEKENTHPTPPRVRVPVCQRQAQPPGTRRPDGRAAKGGRP